MFSVLALVVGWVDAVEAEKERNPDVADPVTSHSESLITFLSVARLYAPFPGSNQWQDPELILPFGHFYCASQESRPFTGQRNHCASTIPSTRLPQRYAV